MVATQERTAPNRYMRKQAAAAYLCVSVRHLDNLIARGQLRPGRLGKRVVLDVKDLDAAVEKSKSAA